MSIQSSNDSYMKKREDQRLAVLLRVTALFFTGIGVMALGVAGFMFAIGVWPAGLTMIIQGALLFFLAWPLYDEAQKSRKKFTTIATRGTEPC